LVHSWLSVAGVGLILAVITLPLFAVSCLWIALLKAILLRAPKPGIYPLHSTHHLRHWLASGLMRTSRVILPPLFTPLYLPHWMRLLGARIGTTVEMSTVWSFMPELIVAGDGSFFADGCILGGRRIHGGWFEVRHNRVGQRSFVGNGAVLPVGAGLGNSCLLG